MNDQPIEGGAKPALAAHSKDASAPGQGPASRATGNESAKSDRHEPGWSGTADRLSGQVRNAADKVASSVSQAAGEAGRQFSGSGSLTAQMTGFTREQPLAALAAVGALGLIAGFLLSRR